MDVEHRPSSPNSDPSAPIYRTERANRSTPAVYDLIGVGLGPSNLALAAAAAEEAPDLAAHFFERQPHFGWHRGMLLEDTTMQVAFLKDLVTLRDPRSSFSFVNYLHECGRLVQFINHKTLFPSRLEFHAYLQWAADRLSPMVSYDSEVISVGAATEPGLIEVTIRSGPGSQQTTVLARTVVLAVGLQPVIPTGAHLSARAWHSSQLLPQLAGTGLDADFAGCFAVVGAGQSAAEAVQHLLSRFPRSDVRAVFLRYGYSPADDSPFANRIFDPSAVEDFFVADDDVKAMMLNYHANTNYSVVDQDLIAELYRRSYQEEVAGVRRLYMQNLSRLSNVTERPDGTTLEVTHLPTGETSRVDADYLIYATGYRAADVDRLLGTLDRFCERDEAGRLVVERDYRVRMKPGADLGLFLQGGTEHSHGISSSLLSNTAVRAGDILAAARARSQARSAVSADI